ncbi:hypothetical protein HMPREF3213_00786 [Heyndrickxia coagulans]|uniref:Uncharacterized protein n=1 Tax=Heyndrickxia coagulans TaxID=1398 RepID=A0A133KYP9_HEYCO|nr:hypothetical protein HMPREF3213_00786 [Heyndrickxia coagulans]
MCLKIVYNDLCKRAHVRQKIDKYNYYIIIEYVIACILPAGNRYLFRRKIYTPKSTYLRLRWGKQP